ncbi:hypothetical protein [Marinobacter sp.]|uniref:hypothetical protein n=1 Tax=Marinobacter sp. TaxID=50741 RepID=UPI003561C92F
MADNDIARARNLTSRLAGCRPLHPLELKQLQEQHSASQSIDFFAGEEEIARKIQAIQERSESQKNSLLSRLWAQSFQKGANDDLELQCRLLNEFFSYYLATGEHPPPASAWRIAVILRKRKEHLLEREFLLSWIKHFGNTIGNTYEKLVDRYRKLNI